MTGGFAVKSLGCRVNQVDSRHLAEALARRGIFPAPKGRPPAVVVVFTCTVTGRADSKSRRALRQARRDNPDSLVVLAGCMASAMDSAAEDGSGGANGRRDENVPWDMAFDLRKSGFDALADAIAARLGHTAPPEGSAAGPLGGPRPGDPALDFFGLERTRAFIKVQGGCDCHCTYCIVPRVRGPVKSRTREEVIAEASSLLAQGVREIVLTGINIGRFGADRGESGTLADLARRILELPGLDRLRFSSIEPMDIDDGILDLAGMPGFCPHLHLPVQSGSDRILKLMGRPYGIGRVIEVMDAVRSRVPEMNFTTDMIAGFPGETEEDFACSLDFVAKNGMTKVHAFPFSPREGTPAASMKPVIPPETASQRVSALMAAGEANFMARGRAMTGTTVEVLVETGGRDGLARGFSRDYMKVAVSPSGKSESSQDRGRRGWPPEPNTMLHAVVDGVRPGELLAVVSDKPDSEEE